jgi:Ankyrin repeats (3 copies)
VVLCPLNQCEYRIGKSDSARVRSGEQMISLRLIVSVLIVLVLLFLPVMVSAGLANEQKATMEELIAAQTQGASEAELITIYRSGLSVESRDKFGVTPLHVACHGKGYLFFAKMLINEGANVNSATRKGWTPLMDACSEPGKAEIVRLLLNNGAMADHRRFDGRSALHLAAFINDFAVARVLVEAGANVNLPDNRGQTPVFYVTGPEVARLLIENGASLSIVDRAGNSPYRYVRNWERERYGPGHNELSSYLKSLGAQ